MLTQGVLLPALGKRFSQLTLAMFSIVVLSVGLLGLAAFENLVYVLAVAAVISFGFGIEFVTLNTLISLNTPKEAQGGALGIAWAIAGLAQSIAPVLATTAFSFGAGFGLTGLVFIISAAISAGTIPLVLLFKKTSH